MYDFQFEKPSTVAEAVAALATEDAMALGGGQTLIPTMKQRLAGCRGLRKRLVRSGSPML